KRLFVFTNTTAFLWRSRGEELHGGQQSFYCFHSQDIGYIACQRRRRRVWIRPGQTAVWWENFEKEVVLPDECRAHHYCLFRSYCIPPLKGVFMRAHVNRNFFENDVVCTTLFLKTEGQKYLFLLITRYELGRASRRG